MHFLEVPQVILISGSHTEKRVLHNTKTGLHTFISQVSASGIKRVGLLFPPRDHVLSWRTQGLTQTPGTWRHCGGRAGPGLCSLHPPQASQAQEQRREGLAVFAEYASALILEMLV